MEGQGILDSKQFSEIFFRAGFLASSHNGTTGSQNLVERLHVKHGTFLELAYHNPGFDVSRMPALIELTKFLFSNRLGFRIQN